MAWLGATNAFFGLLCFLVVLYTRPGDFLPALARLQPAKLTALAALGLFAVWRLMARDLRLRADPVNRWMMALVAAVAASVVLSTDRADSMAAFKDLFVKIVILYVLIVNLVDTPRRATALQSTILLCAAFLGGYALWSKLTGRATIEGSRAGLVGLLADPNDLALVLLTGVPFAVLALLETVGLRRMLYGALGVLAIAGIIATQSRGGLLGLAAALYLILRRRVKSRWLTWAAVAVGLVGLAMVAGIGARQGLETGAVDESAQGRLDAWGAGMRMVKYNPLFGVGFFRFTDNYFDYVVDPVTWDLRAAHNSWIQCFAETGLAGFVPFCGLLAATALGAIRLERWGHVRGLDRAVTHSQWPTLAAVLVSAMFLSQAWNWWFYVLAAQAVAARHVFRPEADSVVPRPGISSTAPRGP